ncbi:MAG: DNA polymerase III subunit beta [Desulfobacteraceae bacterium]|jgi:DNA polymerase-3 subunit beta|nr:DNA polymerase III subunit beta [Desulfobacteraceae bacterium]
MKATINKNDILPVLAKVQGLTGRKTSLAITTNVLLQTTKSGISITATDLETGFEGLYPAKVDAQGVIAINARKLYEIVRDFPSEDIYVNEVDNHWIEIGNQNVEYHIVGLNPDDFPEVPKIEAVDFFEIDSAAFHKMIEKTVIISGASDDSRSHIIGIYTERIQQDDKKLFRMVSTDGSRLSKADFVFDKDFELPLGDSVLIPKKGLVEVAKFLDSEGPVKIGIKDNNFIVKKEKETLIIRLLEGDFPEYGDIIVKTEGHDIVLNRQLFLMMLKRMSILSSDEYKGVIFHFTENKLVINSTNPDIGESKEDMDLAYKGDPVEVMYNPKFFIDTLGVLDEDNIVLNIVDDQRPCKIEGENDNTYLSVIMPMRI